MNTEHLPIKILNGVFIIAGVAGIIYHASDWRDFSSPQPALAFGVRLLAIIGGTFALRGVNWSRWLLLAWMVYHVILSFFHSTSELIMHVIILLGVIFIYFRPQASAYFRKG